MKLVHFTLQDQFHFGMITDANEFIDLDTAVRDYYGVNPVKGADPSRFRDMQAFFGGGADSVELTKKILQYVDRRRAAGWTPRAATGARFLFKPEEGIKLLAPVVRTSKIYCLASNSRSHVTEQGRPLPKNPFVFSRQFNSLVGPSENLMLNPTGTFPDVELELAAVIGQRGKHIPAAKAMEYVAGYTIALDMGYRDLQYPTQGTVDWVMGKGFDATMAVGPWVVPKEEVGEPYPLDNGTQGRRNGAPARRHLGLHLPDPRDHCAPVPGDHLRAGRHPLARQPGGRPRVRVRQRVEEAETGRPGGRVDREDRPAGHPGEGRSSASPRSSRNSASGVGSSSVPSGTAWSSPPGNG